MSNNRYRLLAALAIAAAGPAAGPARADIIFTNANEGYLTQGSPGPDTTDGEYRIPTWKRTGTATTVNLFMLQDGFVEAESRFSDLASLGIKQFIGPVLTKYTGSGAKEALLKYTMAIDGKFEGTDGVIITGSLTTKGLIGFNGSFASHTLGSRHSQPLGGRDFILGYDEASDPGRLKAEGQRKVGGGVDVTPLFEVDNFKFDATVTGPFTLFEAKRIKNTWTEATVTMELIQCPPDPPEPPEPPGPPAVPEPGVAAWAAFGAAWVAAAGRWFGRGRRA